MEMNKPNQSRLPISLIAQKLDIDKATLYNLLGRPEFRKFEVLGSVRRFAISEDFKNTLRNVMKEKWARLRAKRYFYKKVDLL